jgi:hypothetical protein
VVRVSEHHHEGSFAEGEETEEHHPEEEKGSFAEGQEEEMHRHEGDFAEGQEEEERHPEDSTHGDFSRGKTFIDQPGAEGEVEEIVIVEEEIEIREEP